MGTPVVLLRLRSVAAATKGAAGTAVVALGAVVVAVAAGTAFAATKGAAGTAAAGVTVSGPGIALEFDARLHSRVIAIFGADRIVLGPFSASETVQTSSAEIADFAFTGHTEESVADTLGTGRRHRLVGRAGDLEKTVEISLYSDFPQAAVMQTIYTNVGTAPVTIASWTQNRYAVAATNGAAGTAGTAGTAMPATNGAAGTADVFWSYQGGSYERRPDWVLPLKKGFRQENFQGMNADDYGGGTPVADVWRRDAGLAVGHVELVPKLISLPVARPSREQATLGVREAVGRVLAPGEKLTTLRTFVAPHRGDHFASLVLYRRLMLRQGVTLPAAPPDAFQPIWCAWPGDRLRTEFTVEQVVATVPFVKKLGFGWVTLDDGWQVAEGDWTPVRSKFPRGDDDMKAFVDKVHAAGLRAQLWWSPLSAAPGSRTEREHPDWLLLNRDGSTRKISWWNTLYLCPAEEGVRADARAFVHKALGEWGFDGLKIDGQHLNGAPPCYNPAHGHAAPEDAPEGVPEFFRGIWEEAQATRPGALIEICPCGTAYSFFMLPYLNMTVAADPESSWQVRLKGKTLKALHGGSIPYFGDFVELSDGGEDFASTLGVGGVVETNFAWPGAPGKKDKKLLLTPEKEAKWAFWVKLYQRMRLSEGEYLGELYDIGFDRPEAHAIRKGDALYYAFYADRFDGKVELRGLEGKRYRVRDYEAGSELGTVEGPRAPLEVSFKRHLLLEAKPE